MRDTRLIHEHAHRETLYLLAKARARKFSDQLTEHARGCGHCRQGKVGRCQTGSELRRFVRIAEVDMAAHKPFKLREEEKQFNG